MASTTPDNGYDLILIGSGYLRFARCPQTLSTPKPGLDAGQDAATRPLSHRGRLYIGGIVPALLSGMMTLSHLPNGISMPQIFSTAVRKKDPNFSQS